MDEHLEKLLRKVHGRYKSRRHTGSLLPTGKARGSGIFSCNLLKRRSRFSFRPKSFRHPELCTLVPHRFTSGPSSRHQLRPTCVQHEIFFSSFFFNFVSSRHGRDFPFATLFVRGLFIPRPRAKTVGRASSKVERWKLRRLKFSETKSFAPLSAAKFPRASTVPVRVAPISISVSCKPVVILILFTLVPILYTRIKTVFIKIVSVSHNFNYHYHYQFTASTLINLLYLRRRYIAGWNQATRDLARESDPRIRGLQSSALAIRPLGP